MKKYGIFKIFLFLDNVQTINFVFFEEQDPNLLPNQESLMILFQ